jgi:hypothetical protein
MTNQQILKVIGLADQPRYIQSASRLAAHLTTGDSGLLGCSG